MILLTCNAASGSKIPIPTRPPKNSPAYFFASGLTPRPLTSTFSPTAVSPFAKDPSGSPVPCSLIFVPLIVVSPGVSLRFGIVNSMTSVTANESGFYHSTQGKDFEPLIA